MSYDESARALQPPYLRGTNWLNFNGDIGASLDDEVDRATEAAFAGTVERAPSDGLPNLGLDRALRRYPAESEDTYRARLGLAFTLHRQDGTPAGRVATWTAATQAPDRADNPVWSLLQYYQDPPAFGTSGWWSQSLLIADPCAPWLPGWLCGDTPIGDGMICGDPDFICGASITSDERILLLSLIDETTPAYAVTSGVKLVFLDLTSVILFEDFR